MVENISIHLSKIDVYVIIRKAEVMSKTVVIMYINVLIII